MHTVATVLTRCVCNFEATSNQELRGCGVDTLAHTLLLGTDHMETVQEGRL